MTTRPVPVPVIPLPDPYPYPCPFTHVSATRCLPVGYSCLPVCYPLSAHGLPLSIYDLAIMRLQVLYIYHVVNMIELTVGTRSYLINPYIAQSIVLNISNNIFIHYLLFHKQIQHTLY